MRLPNYLISTIRSRCTSFGAAASECGESKPPPKPKPDWCRIEHMKRFVVLAIASVLALAGCATQEAPAVTDPNATKVAFYGDSYTLGTGASAPAKRWSTVVSAERGWTEFNPSVNGLGFINNRTVYGDGDLPSLVIDDDPDILFITMGLNDNFSYPSDRIDPQINDDFDRIEAGLPDARVIVVEPFWYTDERADSVEIIINWVEEAANERGWEFIPGASHWIEGHPEWMADDGLHPNDDGYAEMARRMNAELVKLGL